MLNAQEGLLNKKDSSNTLKNTNMLMNDFKNKGDIALLAQHLSDDNDSPFCKGSSDVELLDELKESVDYVIEKPSCNLFHNINLQELLGENKVSKVHIRGSNTGYCCLFSGILSPDRGYETVFVEDACGTSGDEEIYEMPGLDMNDFIGSILNWSGEVEVLYTKEYFNGISDEQFKLNNNHQIFTNGSKILLVY